jgi:hypothetical protein
MSTSRNLSISLLLLLSSFSVQAAPIDLFQWVFNVDGTIYESGFYPVGSDSLPGSMSGSLDANGLGALSTEVSGVGDHRFVAMLDYEIVESGNTFFNEYGEVGGVLATGQSWEIDEPGWTYGDLYWNTLDATLDNSNNVPYGLNDDVSFALGWDFTLAAGETATIDLFMSEVLNTNGFHLVQNDDETGAGLNESMSIYFWSDISIAGAPSNTGTVSVPEPSALALLGIGLMGLAAVRRRIREQGDIVTRIN